MLVDWFVQKMNATLVENQFRGDWRTLTPDVLMQKLNAEVVKVESALRAQDYDKVIQDCVDVANFAMMLAELVSKAKQEVG